PTFRRRCPDLSASPPYLLVHGAANSARVWTHWRTALAEHGVTSEAIDLRGHGGSPLLETSPTPRWPTTPTTPGARSIGSALRPCWSAGAWAGSSRSWQRSAAA